MGTNNGPLFVWNENPRYARVVVDVETVAVIAPYVDETGGERLACYLMDGDGRPCMTKGRIEDMERWCKGEFR